MKNKLFSNAIFFYIVIFSISFFLFYQLSLYWNWIYRIIFSFLITTILISGIIVLFKSNLLKSLYSNRTFFLNIFIFLFNLIFLFIIFYIYKLPLYYYVFFFMITLLFAFTNYNSFYSISIYLIFWIFINFQLFALIQEITLILIEKSTSLENQIKQELEWQIQKDKEYLITIQKKVREKENSKKITIKLPLDVKFIEKEKIDFDFPIVFAIQPMEKEIPIISCFVLPQNFSIDLFHLRIRSILEKLKSNHTIEEYQIEKIDFYESLLKKEVPEILVQNQFYSYFDKFYADYIQTGFYAIQFEKYFIIFWIREKKIQGFPHDLWVLDILKKNNKIF